jgi:anaerobic magnesium-protoporphyrin IX monomethyl ester cyclase
LAVILIHPPFGNVWSIHAAVPCLTGYLRSAGIKVSAIDANAEFCRFFLTADRWARGHAAAEEHLCRLNAQRTISASESDLYALAAVSLLKCQNQDNYHPDHLFCDDPAQDWKAALRRLGAVSAGLAMASIPFYPEILIQYLVTGVRYFSPYSPFSTKEIEESARQGGLLSGFFENLLAPLLGKDEPEIVGISVSYSGQAQAAFRCAAAVKRIAPRIHVVLGGAWISLFLKEADSKILFNAVDSMVVGDGEKPLAALHKELESGKPEFNKVPGLIWFDRNRDAIVRNESAPPTDIESAPAPEYAMSLDHYPVPRQFLLLDMRASRGCPWQRCAFCATENHSVRYCRTPGAESVFEKIKTVVQGTGIHSIAFADESSNPVVMEHFSRMVIDAQLRIAWMTSVRFLPDLTLSRCIMYRKSGCFKLKGGVEAYNDRLLTLIDKGISVATVNHVLSNMAWAGIGALAYMIVGLPTETEKEALHAYRRLRVLQRKGLLGDYYYSPFEPLEGSAICRYPEKFGLRRLPSEPRFDLPHPQVQMEGLTIMPARAAELSERFNKFSARKPWKVGQKLKLKNGRSITLKHAAR